MIMRIVQLIAQNTIGGAEAFGYAVSAELAHRGHDVLLLANRDNGPLFERERPSNMQVKAIDRQSRLDPRILNFLIGSIRQFSPDILHSHNFESNTWARSLGLLFPGLPIVCHDHSGRKASQPSHRIWIDRMLFPRCAAVLVVSEELGQLLRKRHKVPERILHILPNGIDVQKYTPPPDNKRDPLGVVCVASLTTVKNHEGLLRAWRDVVTKHPGAKLTLVGDGPLKSRLEEQARTEGTHETVEFAGLLDDIRPSLWSASVFTLFSHREAQPLSILEAMAAGLVPVAPAIGGVPQMIVDGVTGRLVPAEETDTLAKILRDLLSSPEECRELARKAREDVEKRYDLRTCVDSIESIYEDIRKKR